MKKNINNMKEKDYLDKSFFRTKVKFGLVCLATLKDIEKINEYIARHPEIKPVYQKVSVNTLRILEGEA